MPDAERSTYAAMLRCWFASVPFVGLVHPKAETRSGSVSPNSCRHFGRRSNATWKLSAQTKVRNKLRVTAAIAHGLHILVVRSDFAVPHSLRGLRRSGGSG